MPSSVLPERRSSGWKPQGYIEGMAAKVYLDTNVYKFSATQLLRLRVEMREVNWGGRKQVLPLHVPVIIDPNERMDETSALRAEVDLLPEVAGLAQRGRATFLISFETQVELSGIPNLDSRTGYVYGAPHTIVQPPVRYSRVLYGGPADPLVAQYRFLQELSHDRFLELRVICGAQQGNRGRTSTGINCLMLFISGALNTTNVSTF